MTDEEEPKYYKVCSQEMIRISKPNNLDSIRPQCSISEPDMFSLWLGARYFRQQLPDFVNEAIANLKVQSTFKESLDAISEFRVCLTRIAENPEEPQEIILYVIINSDNDQCDKAYESIKKKPYCQNGEANQIDVKIWPVMDFDFSYKELSNSSRLFMDWLS